MAATQYTRHILLIARADIAALANDAANQSDTNDGGRGDLTFTNGLSPSGNAPATHYWCSWAMRPAMLSALVTRLRAAGATVPETTLVAFGQTPASARMAAFDLDSAWTPDGVLTTVGLQRVGGAP